MYSSVRRFGKVPYRIRIRIRGSMPHIIMDSDFAIFVIDLQDANQNLILKFFCFLPFEGTFTSYFNDKKSKRSHKTVPCCAK